MQAQKNEAFQFDQWDLLKKHYKEREREKERERHRERETEREGERERYILIYMPCFYLYLFAWSLSLILIFSLPSSHAVVSSVEVPESQHETSSWCDAPKRNGWESASWQSGVRNFLLSSRKSHNDLVHFPLRRMLVFWKTQSIWNIGAKIRSHQKLLVAVTCFFGFWMLTLGDSLYWLVTGLDPWTAPCIASGWPRVFPEDSCWRDDWKKTKGWDCASWCRHGTRFELSVQSEHPCMFQCRRHAMN